MGRHSLETHHWAMFLFLGTYPHLLSKKKKKKNADILFICQKANVFILLFFFERDGENLTSSSTPWRVSLSPYPLPLIAKFSPQPSFNPFGSVMVCSDFPPGRNYFFYGSKYPFVPQKRKYKRSTQKNHIFFLACRSLSSV